jgi:GT2 family glycosyltransferase
MSAPGRLPAISIVIPTCRREQFLVDCLASILGNSFQDFEIIVVDQDRPGGLEATLARRFPGESRIVYLLLEEPHASRARNLGIKHARGEIVVFSDDDVEVERDWLRAYVDAFAACGGEPVVVGGRLDPLWMAAKPEWLPEGKQYLLGIYNRDDRLALMPAPDQPIGANFAVHRKILEAVGPFDERIGPSYVRKRGMIFGEDALLSMRARRAHYPVYYQAAARAWHKMSARKLTKRYFVRRSFWEGVTQLTILHLSGSVSREHCLPLVRWHAGEIARGGRRLARTLLHWRHAANPAREAMEVLSSMASSAGVIRAAFKLRSSGHLPW